MIEMIKFIDKGIINMLNAQVFQNEHQCHEYSNGKNIKKHQLQLLKIKETIFEINISLNQINSVLQTEEPQISEHDEITKYFLTKYFLTEER